MRILIFVILVFFSNFAFSQFSAETIKNGNEIIKSFYCKEGTTFKSVNLSFLKDEAIDLKQKRVLVAYVNNQLAGVIVLSQSLGRYDYFDYLIFISPKFEIEKIHIVNYTSAYGSEIAGKKWLQQFEGKKTDYVFEYGKNIDALSGASFSAPSLTNDINLVFRIIKKIDF